MLSQFNVVPVVCWCVTVLSKTQTAAPSSHISGIRKHELTQLDLFHTSMRERAQRRHLYLDGDWMKLLSVTLDTCVVSSRTLMGSQRTSHINCISCHFFTTVGRLTIKNVESQAKAHIILITSHELVAYTLKDHLILVSSYFVLLNTKNVQPGHFYFCSNSTIPIKRAASL